MYFTSGYTTEEVSGPSQPLTVYNHESGTSRVLLSCTTKYQQSASHGVLLQVITAAMNL